MHYHYLRRIHSTIQNTINFLDHIIDHCKGYLQEGTLSLPPFPRTFPAKESALTANLSGLVNGSYF